MALASGVRLGAYEIIALIGAGGMGEVYRARDTRLKRDVAIKVLPDAFASDTERLSRFQREAELLAALNHQNIAGIFGLEQSGAVNALILELVEGDTLADRIKQGAIPVDEALPIARQIAEALEAAHERGVIHRDLKPANIKLKPDGNIKVLDFGLAKALVTEHLGTSLSLSPTITSPAMATHGGVILGTAAYMSPEQARGKVVDKRTDIWAFGCVLYEMLTGSRAFDGDEVSDTLAAILRAEPDWKRLPAETPAALRRLLGRCLEKDRKNRLADIADARLEIREAVEAPRSDTKLVQVNASGSSRRLSFAIAASALAFGALLSGTIVWWSLRSSAVTTAVQRRFTLSDPSAISAGLFANPQDHNIAISPDGQRLAFVGRDRTLYIRLLDRVEPVHFPELGTVRSPFFSPDGKSIAFFVAGSNELKKILIAGGPPTPIAQIGGTPRGGTWGSDDRIVFATSEASSGLWIVPSTGGKPTSVLKPDLDKGEVFVWPKFIPGTQSVLFTVGRPIQRGPTRIEVFDLGKMAPKTLVESGGFGQYVSSGHLIFSRGDTILAAAFDAKRLQLLSDPVPVLEHIQTGFGGLAYATVSQDGTLVYLPGSGLGAVNRDLLWVSRKGEETPVGVEPKPYFVPRVSPDGTRVAFGLEDPSSPNVFVHDLVRKTSMKLTLGRTPDVRPLWTPDAEGRWIFFRGEANGVVGIYRKLSDGSGSVELVTKVAGDGSVSSFTPDGKTLIFNTFAPATNRDLWTLSLDDKRALPLVVDPGGQGNAVVSPNGRWLAYQDETDGSIFVTPFPKVDGGRWQVATPDSKWPLWSKDGRELFYVAGDPRGMMSIPVETSAPTFKWGTPQRLFLTPYTAFAGNTQPRNYDLSADGRRFVVIKDLVRETAAPSLIVVENWLDDLRRLAPAKH